MADVYKFKVQLANLPEKIWRDMKITSVSSVAKLAYAILAAFEGQANHLYNIQYNGKRYETAFDEAFFGEPAIDPVKTKLSALKLCVGDTLHMEYDYGAGWEFVIELLSITEMKRGRGSHYPCVTDGQGKGIIEDASPYELEEMIETIDQTGEIPTIYDIDLDQDVPWDYREFDSINCNILMRCNLTDIQGAYEGYRE